MVENVENLMLEHLKRFQATLERIEGRLDELTVRQTETHTAVLALRRDQVADAESAPTSKFSSTACEAGWSASSVDLS